MTQTEREPQRCPNCGAEWTPQEQALQAIDQADAVELHCPVCYYRFRTLTFAYPATPLDVHDFIDEISALINRARTEGLSADTISRVLSDELAYNAELANPTHSFHVQVVDLGPASSDTQTLTPNEIRAALRRRSQ